MPDGGTIKSVTFSRGSLGDDLTISFDGAELEISTYADAEGMVTWTLTGAELEALRGLIEISPEGEDS